jgi:plasmid maintenance system killer protein
MLVRDLAMMEKIVAKNNNLKWVGWDVLELKRSNLGRTDVNGIRINDQWYIKKDIKLTDKGWEISNKYRM